MASLRDIRKRIKSVKSTQKITKAMKMVAAARLRRAQEAVEQSRPYNEAITAMLGDLSSSQTHVLMQKREVHKRLLLVLSSDRGLCGAFNGSLFKKVEQDLSQNTNTELFLIGKKANQYFSKRRYPIAEKHPQFWSEFNHAFAVKMVKGFADRFLKGEVDQIDIFYNEFVSVISQKPLVTTLLPLALPKTSINSDASEAGAVKYIFEPNKETIFNALIPKVLDLSFMKPCLNSLASEFGARMSAMDSASRNAGDMIDSLTLHMNRVRQAGITKELMEIISGAEAIK